MLFFRNEDMMGFDLQGKSFSRRTWWRTVAVCVLIFIIVVGAVVFNLRPVSTANSARLTAFEVAKGEGFSEIAKDLASDGLIRSRLAFEVAALASGRAFHIQPGTYELSPASSAFTILGNITGGSDQLVTVTIPEGSNIYQIDEILAENSVIHRGTLIAFKDDGSLEGKLFPDTYQFFRGSDIAVVVRKFLNNFDEKAGPVLAVAGANETKDLIAASILEKEVQGPADQKIVAGILEKRIASGMRLQIDATVCYAKQITEPNTVTNCAALVHVDFTPSSSYNSAYNTYLHAGLPPGPIGNPGTSSITAAMHPVSSSYWYYLSDPKTGKTIYAKTLAEQTANIKKYLNQ
jgi:UPF0755 protein